MRLREVFAGSCSFMGWSAIAASGRRGCDGCASRGVRLLPFPWSRFLARSTAMRPRSMPQCGDSRRVPEWRPCWYATAWGGLVARAWLRACGADAEADVRVCHVLTLGTPHHGAWLAHFGQSACARQMRPDSGWLQALARTESPARRALFSCWYSDCDNIVFPAATARLEGAQNRRVPGLAHLQLAFDDEVIRDCLARIGQLDRKESSPCP